MYRRVTLVGMAALIGLTALMGIFPQTAYAAGPVLYKSPEVELAAKRSTQRNSLALCVAKAAYNFVGSQNIASGVWFPDNPGHVRQYFDENGGGVNGGTTCDKIPTAQYLKDLGFSSNIEAACAFGIERTDLNEKNNCANGSSAFQWKDGSKQNALNVIDKTYKGTSLGKDYTDEQYYVMAMDLLTSSKACQASVIGVVTTPVNADLKNRADDEVAIVDENGKVQKVYYTYGGDKGKLWSFSNYTGDSMDYVKSTCKDLAVTANRYANNYATWVSTHKPGTDGNAGSCEQYAKLQLGAGSNDTAATKKIIDACTAGLQNKADANYCSTQYPEQGDPIAARACLYGRDNAYVAGSTDDPTGGDEETKCAISGIGWFVCPAMDFMAFINDGAYSFLSSYFLSIDSDLLGDTTKATWSKFRDIANVAFVIAILFIVYSQVTSMGINNYGIKKMLPRLIVAALLVNISFFICAIAVDLSNVVGYAIPQFFDQIVPLGGGISDTTGGGAAGAIVGGLAWVAVIGTVLAGGAGILLALSVPVILAALLAVGLVVLMLIGRQALIVLLIVVSPIAFVAYLLPNTEQWFKKWYKAFFTLLVLFPVVGVVFGASRMAAVIIRKSGGDNSDEILMQLIALAISTIPFFVVPSLLKGSLSAAGSIGTKIGGAVGKATGNVGARVKDSSKIGTGLSDMKKYREQQRAIKFAKKRGSGAIGAFGRVRGGKKYNEKARLQSQSLENQEYESDIKAADENQAKNMTYKQRMAIADGTNTESTDIERDAAIRFMSQNGNTDERRQVLESMGSMKTIAQRRSAVNGARGKGDGTVYGNSTLGKLADMTDDEIKATNVADFLKAGTTDRISNKEILPETFTRDTMTAKYIADQSVNATDAGRNSLAKVLSDHAATDQGKKVADATQDESRRAIASAPTQPTPPTGAQVNQGTQQGGPVGGQQQNQLNIQHGNTPPANTPPTTPPAGTNNFTQNAAGIFVPPTMNIPPAQQAPPATTPPAQTTRRRRP